MKLISRSILAGFLFLTFAIVAASRAASPRATAELPILEEIEVTAVGATEDEAFNQAVVNAVRQVIGTLVSSETIIKNERVVSEKILTYSNGFVEKVISKTSSKGNDGIYSVSLRCAVRSGKIQTELKLFGIPTIKFDGVSLGASLVSKAKEVADRSEIIAQKSNEAAGFMHAVTKFEFIKQSGVDIISRDYSGYLNPGKGRDEYLTIKFPVKVSVDSEAVVNRMGDLKTALDAAGKSKGSSRLRFSSGKTSLTKQKVAMYEIKNPGGSAFNPLDVFTRENVCIPYLNVQSSKPEFAVWQLSSGEIKLPNFLWMFACGLDSDNKLVAIRRLKFYPEEDVTHGITRIPIGFSNENRAWFPGVISDTRVQGSSWLSVIEGWTTIRLKSEDFKRISRFENVCLFGTGSGGHVDGDPVEYTTKIIGESPYYSKSVNDLSRLTDILNVVKSNESDITLRIQMFGSETERW